MMVRKPLSALLFGVVLFSQSCALLDSINPDIDDKPEENNNFELIEFSDFSLEEVTDTYDGMGEKRCIQAVCPPGKQVLGGGGDFGLIKIEESAPIDGSQAWRICGRATMDLVWTVQAICAKASVNLARSQAERILETGESACAEAICPQGSRALSGGFVSENSVAGASRIAGDGWVACANGGPDNPKITSHVICADTNSTRIDFGEGEQITLKDRPQECIDISCPEDHHILTGSRAWVGGVQVTQSMATSESTWEMCGVAPLDRESKWTLEAVCIPEQ